MTIALHPTQSIENGAVHEYFGTTGADHLVIHRVLMQSMPPYWQDLFTELLEQYDETFKDVPRAPFYQIIAADLKPIDELTHSEAAMLGVTHEFAADDTDVYRDRDGNQLDPATQMLVPITDPLPDYADGRTRIPIKAPAGQASAA